jgi:hypothetical protein
MNQASFICKAFLCACFTAQFAAALQTQSLDCTLRPPVITINFGQGRVADINEEAPQRYSLVWSTCPNDGFYTFASATSDCFRGDWFTLTEDHTPGDGDGNMMLVNASPEGGVFLNRALGGLKGGATYEFKAWMMNVCRIRGGCPPLPPNILVRLTTTSGKPIAQFQTGELVQTAEPRWTPYTQNFTMPTGAPMLVLTMVNNTTGGCGNDFALDDITFRECVTPELPISTLAMRVSQAISQQIALKKDPTPATLPKVIPAEQPKEEPFVKPASRTSQLEQGKKEPAPVVSRTAPKPVTTIPTPTILLTRENSLIKQIETSAGEIKIDLYDNGVVDGDTVSVYHNNELIVSSAALTQRPISFRIQVSSVQPVHELIMVAHNLGSIPPNTSLMIVTAGDKRYEAFISSSEQKNAKVVVSLKE